MEVPKFVPLTEDHPQLGGLHMQLTKLVLIRLRLVIGEFETPVAVLRPFNTYGPSNYALFRRYSQIASGQRRIRLGALSPTRILTMSLILVKLSSQLPIVMKLSVGL